MNDMIESEYKIEKLIGLGLIRVRKPRFVSPTLMESGSADKRAWRSFLREKLKCEEEKPLKDLAEEVGIESTILYELSQGCIVEDPRPPGLSISPGYDLKSTTPKGEIKLIESKGTKEYGTFDMNISPNEYATLNTERRSNERYYIYAVKDALDSPIINVLDGEDVKTVAPRVFLNERGGYRKGWQNICKVRINVIELKAQADTQQPKKGK